MHVDWTSIAQRATSNGLRVAGFADQHHFLTGTISELGDSPDSPKARRELQTLLHPEMLGRAFQVLALEKNVTPGTRRLAGFKFARDLRSTLRLELDLNDERITNLG